MHWKVHCDVQCIVSVLSLMHYLRAVLPASALPAALLTYIIHFKCVQSFKPSMHVVSQVHTTCPSCANHLPPGALHLACILSWNSGRQCICMFLSYVKAFYTTTTIRDTISVGTGQIWTKRDALRNWEQSCR